MIVLLIRTRAIDPIKLVAQRQYFEFFQQNAEFPCVRHETENVGPGFRSPVFDEVLKELLVSVDNVGGRFAAGQIDIPLLMVIPSDRIMDFHFEF